MAENNPDSIPSDVENTYTTPANDPKNMQEVTQYVQTLLQTMQDKFQSMSDQIINRIDEMGTRVDELEKNITDLMTQAGVENEK
ncbi:Heat shock factor-binding protein 1 [Papilio machaon]|uniref:Heat shock factor-binding protein 1 n=2 Tax=Papilio TaxID=7145 RepID=A0A194PNS8_PAPXU|nr:PREDICTED: heat shock factor-binding protein 1 [Papilio xuthus]XP_014362111.1 heat shock factor-binding protein 1 [Papilio machaon]KPI94638.1 Heat shock factor-binding protein 1 [Papilio xuthus]KPJ12254.1 Heat shock factor-binding protein 1 [Papilio machaon]